MSRVFTVKKPKYVGAKAEILAAQQVIGVRGPERERAVRRIIGEAFKGQPLHVIRNGKHRLFLTDPILPEGLEFQYEGQVVVHFVHEDGAALFSKLGRAEESEETKH